jgi:hypothetical protein
MLSAQDDVVLLSGEPYWQAYAGVVFVDGGATRVDEKQITWCRCSSCAKLGLWFVRQGASWLRFACGHTYGATPNDYCLAAAYNAARSARFEYGESGLIRRPA